MKGTNRKFEYLFSLPQGGVILQILGEDARKVQTVRKKTYVLRSNYGVV